MVMTITSFC